MKMYNELKEYIGGINQSRRFVNRKTETALKESIIYVASSNEECIPNIVMKV